MANIDKVDLSNLGKVLQKELKDYEERVYSAVVETCEEGIKEAKREIEKDLKDLRKGRKEDGKHYRSSFVTRKKSDTSRFLWNREYQLSHLLEDGHHVYNQYGGPYEIHPEYPLYFGYKGIPTTLPKKPKIYGSYWGTSGKVTHKFGAWDKTEKHTADFVEKELLKKLK